MDESKPLRPKRPRVTTTVSKQAGALEVNDNMAFMACLGSKNAREIRTVPQNISLELWFDKHYYDRNQHGSDDGTKRNIPPEAVEALVVRSLNHLLFYSSVVRNFIFLNHEDSPSIIRTIIKDSSGVSPLSVTIQAHFKNFNKYQFTVITAIDDNLRLSAGQYFIEFIADNHSVLYKFDNNKNTEVFSCQD